ncbi:6,7-dimethyl-8-ribityllumazine synthase [Halobacteriales archaeon QS_3_64_16]|nr:MAG: 6,7-dimethyl-8-ribityllumazine synthase [Halobacteriales archaeon QS_3_64_16]
MRTLGVVVAQFNRAVTEGMEASAAEAAEERGAEVGRTIPVPGVYDAPLAADRLARQGDIDAICVLGAVIEGDTEHDRVITEASARSLSAVSIDRDTPITLGVTGPGMSSAEARERVDKGREAVEGALSLLEELP